jgi:hypothetical protein
MGFFAWMETALIGTAVDAVLARHYPAAAGGYG